MVVLGAEIFSEAKLIRGRLHEDCESSGITALRYLRYADTLASFPG